MHHHKPFVREVMDKVWRMTTCAPLAMTKVQQSSIVPPILAVADIKRLGDPPCGRRQAAAVPLSAASWPRLLQKLRFKPTSKTSTAASTNSIINSCTRNRSRDIRTPICYPSVGNKSKAASSAVNACRMAETSDAIVLLFVAGRSSSWS